MKVRPPLLFLITGALMVLGCGDSGTSPGDASPSPENQTPAISSVSPDSANAGDVLTIRGSNFGPTRGTSTLRIGGISVTEYLSWTTTEIRVRVPSGVSTGSVIVTVEGRTSNAVTLRIIGSAPTGISFAATILPRLQSTCVGCHGGTNNLFLNSYVNLLAGTSRNGPVVIPGNGEGSLLVRVLRGTVPSIQRMPLGGPYLSTSEIDNISLWITQGAQNN